MLVHGHAFGGELPAPLLEIATKERGQRLAASEPVRTSLLAPGWVRGDYTD